MERNNGKVVDKVSTLQKELIMTRQRMYDWSVKATGPVKATLAPGQSFFVSGLVKDRDSGEPVSNGRVAFLMMRDRYTFLAETDEAGRFTVKIPELSRNEEAIYRVFQKTKEIDNASVILDEYEPVYDLTLPDKPQRYTAAMVTYRRKAAVRSQFMDAYGSYFQAEEEVERDYKQLDLPKPDFSVTPDDYVVMQNMEELFREIVPGVFLRNRKDGWRLRIFSPERKESYSNAPLLLVDGQPVFDLDKMLAIDPFNVQRVDTYNFLSSMSQFGSLGSNGVLSIITKDGSFQNAAVDEERVVSIRGYANSSWQEPAPLPGDAGLPLLNPAVYYHPNVRVDESGYFRVRFNQSDELSDFIIQVQGYTDLGEPVIYTTTYSNKTAQ